MYDTYSRIEERCQIDKSYKLTNSYGTFIICYEIPIP